MYEKPACGDYQAQFRMVNNKGLDTVVPVDSFLNNPHTYQLSSDGKRLMRPQAGGYRMRFALPAGSVAADSLRICVDAYKMSYRCVGCAAGGSDAIFGPTDIDIFCPYNNATNNDLLACYRRDSREGNWEAWITDPRDCQPYRIILMPDGKWWFARNLSYTKNLINSGDANKGLRGADASSDNNLLGNYWCPGGKTIADGKPQTNKHDESITPNDKLTTGGLAACNVYGALYTWNTAISLDGRGMKHTPTKVGLTSATQGICPEGWLLPSDFDWGVMLNAVEGCPNPTMQTLPAPCNHLTNDNSSNSWLGDNAAPSLKSTLSAPPHSQLVDTTAATLTNAAWPWRRADYQGKISASASLGNDKYGFGLLPAGFRHPNPSTGFRNLGNAAYLWSSTQSNDANRSIVRGFDYQHTTASRITTNNASYNWAGLSIRCIKQALPSIAGIVASETTSYLNTEMPVSFGRQEGTWTYTWGVSSSTITNIATKVTFAANGTSATHSATAKLALEPTDVNKSFTLKLVVNNGSISKTLTKEITVVPISLTISVNSNSVGGLLTATAITQGSGKYLYAWGDGNQNFTTDNTNSQNILTASGTKAQTKTWYLKVKDTKTGVESSQISKTYTFPDIPAGTTFCNSCASNGKQNVDAWLTPTIRDTGYLTTESAYGLANATDINNGRLNCQRLHASGYAGLGLYGCLRKGSGWYIPAAEEYCRIKAANLHSAAVADVSGTWISTIQTATKNAMGITCWRSGEPSGNGPGIAIWRDYLLDDFGPTNAGTRHVVCIWRPED
ncbi:MAG: fibrobacter succinogenes major paralogous domain-containing protein [Prevotellaceae bacterium]|nr:fibrobacter succinogenes major paralogous domain-containing protein [Prevotellaceae bacterium]